MRQTDQQITRLHSSTDGNYDIALVNTGFGPLAGRSGAIVYLGETESKNSLTANTEIIDFWIMPSGELWAGDEYGHVFTSVPAVQLTLKGHAPLSLLTLSDPEAVHSWQVKKVSKYPIMRIWGTSDHDVWLFTDKEIAYHFDGNDWQEFSIAAGAVSVCGRSADDIYVGTRHSQIVHFDGLFWSPVPYPELGLPIVVFTDFIFVENDMLLAIAKNGVILHGNAEYNFDLCQAPVLRYFGVEELHGYYYFACAEDGLYECKTLQQPLQMQKLKNAKQPISITKRRDVLKMTVAENDGVARMVSLIPAGAAGEAIVCKSHDFR
jgi:hypothetical protein